MLRSTGDSSGTLSPNLGLGLLIGAAGMDVDRLGRVGYLAIQLIGRDEVAFALVPGRQDLGAGGAPQDSRVDETWELHMGDVSAGAEDAFEIPDCLCSVSCVSLCGISKG